MKKFNTVGQCIPGIHYMVDINDKLVKIKDLIDDGYYFVINRARQYGKTTTLGILSGYLKAEYAVISLDFQMMSNDDFKDEKTFVNSFTDVFLAAVRENKNTESALSAEMLRELENAEAEGKIGGLRKLFVYLSKLCRTAKKPIVLMIDEVDSAANNQVFLDFLAQLRGYYIARNVKPTFYSVILAGVYDIKNLKLKLRPESEHKYNSPWNIAEPFDVDMSFSVDDIAGMLRQYENDRHIGMDVQAAAQVIYEYTSGYPFLVSYICKVLDEDISKKECFIKEKTVWSESGIAEAVKLIIKEPRVSLFGSMMKQLDVLPELRTMLSDILYQGKTIPYSPLNEPVNIGMMFGFLAEKNGTVVVANRIFEMVLVNLFISEEAATSSAYRAGARDKNQFIKQGMLDMDLVMAKFVEYYTDVCGDNEQKFIEEQGRRMFLLFLKPIINGTGNAYMEAATRDLERTDVIIDYLGKQFIVELKIWRGDSYNTRGEKQLCGYLDFYRQKKGYLLSFNFNKNKKIGMQVIHIGDKTIVEAVV